MKERVVATNAEQMPKINYKDQGGAVALFTVQSVLQHKNHLKREKKKKSATTVEQ